MKRRLMLIGIKNKMCKSDHNCIYKIANYFKYEMDIYTIIFFIKWYSTSMEQVNLTELTNYLFDR